MKLPLLMTILLFSSCSNINTSSQDYYNLTRSLRHGVVPMDAPSEVTKVRLDSTAAASGKVLFQKHCASCHGVDGKGEGAEGKKHFPAPVDLTKLAKEIPNFKLFIKISKWQGDMPGWKNQFNPEELEQLEQYIQSLALGR